MGKARGYLPEPLPKVGQGLSILAVIFLAITFILCVLAYCAPFWLIHRTEYFDQGLWGKCFFDEELAGREGCRWVWQFEWALEKSLPVWWKAAQTMYSIGVLTTLFAFFIACANLFCSVGYGSVSVFILQGVLTTVCFVLYGVSVLSFGLMSYFDKTYNASVNSAVMNFGWAFFVAICGVITSCFTAATYFIAYCLVGQERRREDLKRYRYEYSTVS